MASRTEKYTVAYRNVKKCEFHNIGAYIVAISIIGGTTFCAFFDTGLHTEEKHTRHNKKPLLEFQYNDNDTASFSIYLSAFLGVNPRSMQNKIDKYRKKGKILPLVIGGKRYGKKWVITSHSKEYERFDDKGNLLIAKSNISLEEYAER